MVNLGRVRARAIVRSFGVAVWAAGGVFASPAAAQTAERCGASHLDAVRHLVGEWQVETTDGDRVGTLRFAPRSGGCALAGSLSTAEGELVISLLREGDRWRWLEVAPDGSVLELALEDGAAPGDLVLDGRWRRPQGAIEVSGTLAREGTSIARRFAGDGERPRDWLLVGAARRSQERATPAVTAAPRETKPARERAPAPAEAAPRQPSQVEAPAAAPKPVEVKPVQVTPFEVRSKRAQRQEEIAVECPLVLEVPLGSIETLGDGYFWTAPDTGAYHCQGTSIPEVKVGRRSHGAGLMLVVVIGARGKQYSQRHRLAVEVLDASGAVLGSGSVANLSAGYGVPSQIQNGAVRKTFDLQVGEQAFAGGARPTLRITLGVFEG